MKNTLVIAGLLLMGLHDPAYSASNENEGSRGMTLEDLGRGLKSAAQNVEKEIPKIGSAIGKAVKKVTEKERNKEPSKASKDTK